MKRIGLLLLTLAVLLPARSQGFVVDSFLVYKAKPTTAFTPITGVTLLDTIDISLDVTVSKVAGIATSTDVNSAGVFDHDTHLTVYTVKADKGQPRHVVHTVDVTNQFGTITVATKRAKRLLVPASKGLSGYLPMPNLMSIQVGHYLCNKVKPSASFAAIAGIHVVDQFQDKVVTVKKPYMLCSAAEKHWQSAVEVPNAPNDHLLCYKVKASGQPRHMKTLVYAADQFGQITMETVKERELCVPSSIAIINPAQATFTPTNTPVPLTQTPTHSATPIETMTPADTSTPTVAPTATPETFDYAPAIDALANVYGVVRLYDPGDFTCSGTYTDYNVSGTGKLKRGPSFDSGGGVWVLPAELLELTLTDNMMFVVQERLGGSNGMDPMDPPCTSGMGCSSGYLQQVTAGMDFAALAYLDVYYRLSVDGGSTFVASQDQSHMFGIEVSVPLSGDYNAANCNLLVQGPAQVHVRSAIFQYLHVQ